MIILSLGWAGRAILGTLLIVPSWISIGFFEKNFRVPPEVFLLWYFAGMIPFVGLYLLSQGTPIIPTPLPVFVGIVMMGFFFAGPANILLFSAVGTAPNPGLAVAISSTASMLVTLLSIFFAYVVPKYFRSIEITSDHILGVLLTLMGIYLMVRK